MTGHPTPFRDFRGIDDRDVHGIEPSGDPLTLRRLTTPLERLGAFEADNPELFRFLRCCASIPGIAKLDHCTFVTEARHTERFLEYWSSKGFDLHGEWHTERYPARHIALIRGQSDGFPWAEMVGLTVTDHPDSPIHRTMPPLNGLFVQTHQLQHVAVNVEATVPMENVRAALEAMGVAFMTPVLSYTDSDGAGLRQMFTATNGGFFIELAQRLPSPSGTPFAGFHPEIIDDLYTALDRAATDWASSSDEVRTKHRQWLPAGVRFRDAPN